MYQIRCDDYILYDPRDEDLIVLNPKCKLKENTVGEGSFTILSNHPYYNKLKKLKSIFEIQQDGHPIFRGRMTGDSRDFHNRLDVDLEGVLGFTNDTLIPPFNFPEDFPEAANAANIVEYFLGWILDQHNACVKDWQKLKLGRVTVADPNNYITRSADKYASTWDTLKSKLFDSALGGYLTIRYETDGNYVDYLCSYELTNTQRITLSENMLDIKNESDASETYSAILPVGKDGLTLADLPDGKLSDDIMKDGLYIYSKSAVEEYGWKCVPVNESTWNDVTIASNLQSKALEYLSGTAMLLSATITIKAVDLHFTDEEIQTFRVYRNVIVDSPVHGVENATYRLSELSIDLLNPQNTVITIGEASRSLIDINAGRENNVDVLIQSTKNELKEFVSNLEQKIEGIDGLFFYIKYSQYEDGHIMTDIPDENTQYMGTCSTNKESAPTDPKEYTWCKVKGANGTPGKPGDSGKTSYLHVKYSDDGESFTGDLLSGKANRWLSGLISTSNTSTIETPPNSKGYPGYISFDGVIFVTPGETLNIRDDGNKTSTFYPFFYDMDGAFLSAGSAMWNANPILTIPGGVSYVRFSLNVTGFSSFDDYQNALETGTLKPHLFRDGVVLGEDLGAWIGTLVDFVEEDSMNFDDYTWKKFTEDVDGELNNIRQTIKEQYTSIMNNCQSIILSALKRYVETSNYEEFRHTVESELSVLPEKIELAFTSTTEMIDSVNGDLEAVVEKLTKHFVFDVDGLLIKAGEGAMNLVLDNDIISFQKDGQQFGWWDGVDFHTGNIVVNVNERAQFGNFAFVPRSNGSLSFLKVGG